MSHHVHWHEGLFLQPHHFQTLERGWREQAVRERQLWCRYPYGLIDAELSEGDLVNRKVRFTRLHAVMPSGVEVRLGENTELEPLDIEPEFKELRSDQGSLRIMLALPLWSSQRANTLDPGPAADRRIKRLYRVVATDLADENTGKEAQRVQLRLLNARLMLDGGDFSEMEVLPLLRVVRTGKTDASVPGEDRRYAPPCLVLRGSKALRELVHDLAEQIQGASKDLVEQMKRSGFSPDIIHWPELKSILRLRTLNRYGSRLTALNAAPRVAPFELYLELRELLGDLLALHPGREDAAAGDYDHDALWPCFEGLCTRIRPMLHELVEQTVIQVPFLPAGDMLRAPLEAAHLAAGISYYLGIKTRVEPTALAQYITDGDRFKLMPPSDALRAVRGVALKHAPFVSYLPTQADLHYFQLDPSARDDSAEMWGLVRDQKAAVIPSLSDEWNWDNSTFTLYLIMPRGQTVS
jgi:type VI secretion system protein ImpJ